MAATRKIKTLERKTLHTIILASVGAVILLFVLLFFGMQLLINLSVWIGKFKGGSASPIDSQNLTYIAPPIMNPAVQATNSARISILGSAAKNQIINLYINNRFVDKAKTKDDRSFIFTDVTLDQGNNDIKTKAIDSNKQSDYSTSIQIFYSNKQPKLDIDTPKDGQIYGGNPITVSGTTDANVKITVNDFWAIVADDGKFSYALNAKSGDNTITINALDTAGNKTTKEVKIHLQ